MKNLLTINLVYLMKPYKIWFSYYDFLVIGSPSRHFLHFFQHFWAVITFKFRNKLRENFQNKRFKNYFVQHSFMIMIEHIIAHAGLKAEEKRFVFKQVLETVRDGACLTSRDSSLHILGAKIAYKWNKNIMLSKKKKSPKWQQIQRGPRLEPWGAPQGGQS